MVSLFTIKISLLKIKQLVLIACKVTYFWLHKQIFSKQIAKNMKKHHHFGIFSAYLLTFRKRSKLINTQTVTF